MPTGVYERKIKPIEERFWTKVNKTEGCWLWLGHLSWDGRYGRFNLQSRWKMAHRVAWEITYGPIPTGLNVLHHCDVPLCVNPSHLFLGTQRDNMRDMLAKGRHNPPRGTDHWFRRHPELVPRGDTHRSSKLTPTQVLDIRQRYAGGEYQLRLAKEFGISQPHIGAIVHRRAWKHL